MSRTSLKSPKYKIVSLAKAVEIAKKARKKGFRIVTTNGAFDLLHASHVQSLADAKSHGDLLLVGINSDASVRRNKGSRRPIISARERAFMVAGLASVDCVFVFGSKTPIPWILKIRPHVHAKGSDRAIDEIVEKYAVEKHGGRVVLLPHTGLHSTTMIIKRILRTQRKRKPESK